MINWQWERGILQFSSKRYSRVRRNIHSTWNLTQELRFKTACDMYSALQRNCDSQESKRDAFFAELMNEISIVLVDILADALRVHGDKLRRPVPGLFPKVSLGAGDKVWVWPGRAYFRFIDSRRELEWMVVQGHLAVHLIHDDAFVSTMFDVLENEHWTRGNGGVIWRQTKNAQYEGLAPLPKYKFGPIKLNEMRSVICPSVDDLAHD
jgi:hypothetical protein